MVRMQEDTIARLRSAVRDHHVISRYRAHIVIGAETDCHLWVGAISGKGHGRFQIGSETSTLPDGKRARRTYVVIAHRFGYALTHGVDELLKVPIIAHWKCDNPLCQNPDHWRASTHLDNGRDYANRRHTIGTPLADRRGARGRAHAIRAAARNGEPVTEAVLAGLPKLHTDQPPLFTEQLEAVTDLRDLEDD